MISMIFFDKRFILNNYLNMMENKQVYLYLCLWSDKFFFTLELIIHTMFREAHFLF